MHTQKAFKNLTSNVLVKNRIERGNLACISRSFLKSRWKALKTQTIFCMSDAKLNKILETSK